MLAIYIQVEGLPGYVTLFLENTSFTVNAASDKLSEAEVKGAVMVRRTNGNGSANGR